MYGKRAKDAVIVRNAIDTERFCADFAKREKMRTIWGAKDKVIGHIGRFEYEKNHIFLLNAFATILKSRKDALLVLVGRGSLESAIKAEIDRLGIQDSVIFMPEVYAVEEYYNGFDLFLLPSIYEGLPLVGVEAQSVGVPCIFSDAVTREADLTEDSAFLPIDEPSVWAQAALKILDEPFEPKPYLVKQKGFDIRSAAAELEQLYRRDL